MSAAGYSYARILRNEELFIWVWSKDLQKCGRETLSRLHWTVYVNEVFCILLVIHFGVLISCLFRVILSGQLAGVQC